MIMIEHTGTVILISVISCVLDDDELTRDL